MAKAEKRTARKDYPEHGIAKGDVYYYAQIKTGPRSSKVIRQKEPIKQSQLTSSEYLSRLYDIQERVAEVSDLESMREIAEELRELGQEQRDKFDNMPEGLQQGDTGQMLSDRADACESAADEIETQIDGWDEDSAKEEVLSEAESNDEELSEGEVDDRVQERLEEVLDAIRDTVSGVE